MGGTDVQTAYELIGKHLERLSKGERDPAGAPEVLKLLEKIPAEEAGAVAAVMWDAYPDDLRIRDAIARARWPALERVQFAEKVALALGNWVELTEEKFDFHGALLAGLLRN